MCMCTDLGLCIFQADQHQDKAARLSADGLPGVACLHSEKNSMPFLTAYNTGYRVYNKSRVFTLQKSSS